MIYGDKLFHALDKRFRYFSLSAPSDYPLPTNQCNILGVSTISHQYKQFQHDIDFFRKNTKKLLVYIAEPTHQGLVSFLESQDLDIHFFADAVLNKEIKNFSTVISWFVEPVNYYTSDLWAKNLLSRLSNNRANRPFKFDCLLGCERPHRDRIFDFVCSHQHRDQFIITYYRNYNNIQTHGVWDVPGTIVDEHDLEIEGRLVNRYSILPVDIYNQSYYSIITETSVCREHNQYTEKVAKPIIAKRPFVVFSGPHYLRGLQQLGFKTFNKIIDESYDNETSESTRFSKALDQVNYLLHQNPEKTLAEIDDVLEYNYQHFISTDWWWPIRQYLK